MNPAIRGILGRELVQDPSKCLRELQYKSLLTYDTHTHRYRYHQLIKEFFSNISSITLYFTVEKEQFSDHFATYYATLYCKIALPDVETTYDLRGFQTLDLERCNFEYLFKQDMEISIVNHLDILNRVSCNIFGIFLMTSEAHVQQLIAIAKRFMNEMQLQYLTGLNLIKYCQFLLWNILMQYDVQFALISNHTGKSTYFKVYVNLLTMLSKVDGWSHRLQILLSRSKRVEELYHLASTDNSSSSRMVYAKYYSALANSYIRLNQYDKFLKCWQKILFLKKQLQDCENKRCSHLHKGLAYFGRGDYEQAIEHLHPLLKLEKLSASRKARILILLYESYSNIGDLVNAEKILHSKFYEDILQQLSWHATHLNESGCYVKCGSLPPPDIPQLTDAHQPYTEPSIEDELVNHCCTSDPHAFVVYKLTDDSPYQCLYTRWGQDNSIHAHTLDNDLQRMILKLLNQGATRENYITLRIAATFYSSGRGEEDKEKLYVLSNAVKGSRECIQFHVCSVMYCMW